MTLLDRRSLLLRALAGAVALPALAGRAAAATHTVTIRGMAFNPGSLTVATGDTVVFANADGVPHTATADDGGWDTGRLAPGASAGLTFAAVGTYAYHCAIHPSMTGTVAVA